MTIAEPRDTLHYLRELGNYCHVDCFGRVLARAEAAEAKIEKLRRCLANEQYAASVLGEIVAAHYDEMPEEEIRQAIDYKAKYARLVASLRKEIGDTTEWTDDCTQSAVPVPKIEAAIKESETPDADEAAEVPPPSCPICKGPMTDEDIDDDCDWYCDGCEAGFTDEEIDAEQAGG